MKVGILSDTHNDSRTLIAILQQFREDKINTIFHCGDVTSPEAIKHFNGFTVHLAFGNGDYLTGALQESLIHLGTDSTAKRLNIITIEEKQVLIAHGNYERELQDLVSSGRFDYIFTGHSHKREKTIHGKTRVINPGAANRTGDPPFSYAVFDFENEILDFHQIF